MKLASLLTTASLLVGTAVSAMDYKEAPSLKEMVSKGEIPPIEQRLPKTPFVVEKGVISHADELPDWKPLEFMFLVKLLYLDFSCNLFAVLESPM